MSRASDAHAGLTAVIAHRGASAYAPEHSFAAYDLALAMRADVLELDVHCTADGEVVVLHDHTFQRTAGDPRRVAEVTCADLSGLDVLTLDAVLERYGAGTRYLVEIKDRHRSCARRVLETVERHGLAERVVVQSFDRLALRTLRRTETTVPLAALSTVLVPSPLLRRGLPRTSMSVIVPCAANIDEALVTAAHGRGVGVYGYTVNDEAEMERLVGLGVDGVVSDRPDLLRAVVDRRLALTA
jgi:glycerophosphoryl diester phosphodiesterase